MAWKSPRTVFDFLDLGFDLKTLFRLTAAAMISFATQLFGWFAEQTVAFQWGWGACVFILSLVGITQAYQTISNNDATLLSLNLSGPTSISQKPESECLPSCDMPLADVIQHRLVQPARHAGYGNRFEAERLVVADIYKLACDGKVLIAGEAHGQNYPVTLPREVLNDLQPCECVTPRGVVWILAPIIPKVPMCKEYSPTEDDGSYWNLHVSSRDIYRLWP